MNMPSDKPVKKIPGEQQTDKSRIIPVPSGQNCTFENTCDDVCYFRVEWDTGFSHFNLTAGDTTEYPIGAAGGNLSLPSKTVSLS
jgi:hypothetical protein